MRLFRAGLSLGLFIAMVCMVVYSVAEAHCKVVQHEVHYVDYHINEEGFCAPIRHIRTEGYIPYRIPLSANLTLTAKRFKNCPIAYQEGVRVWKLVKDNRGVEMLGSHTEIKIVGGKQ